MNRILFYLLRLLAFISRSIFAKWYMPLIMKAYKRVGVDFIGAPEYIHYDAFLDANPGNGGRLVIGNGCVISTKTVILTHDWSFLIGMRAINAEDIGFNDMAFKSVTIGEHSFIGAGAIVLPGTKIGKYCIIGAGAVIKGNIEDYSIMIGNPAKKYADIREWGEHLISKYDR